MKVKFHKIYHPKKYKKNLYNIQTISIVSKNCFKNVCSSFAPINLPHQFWDFSVSITIYLSTSLLTGKALPLVSMGKRKAQIPHIIHKMPYTHVAVAIEFDKSTCKNKNRREIKNIERTIQFEP